MTVSLKHAFTSNVADSGNTTLVQPSNWNAEHTLTAAANTLLGAVTAGAVTEISCTAAGRTLIAGASAAAQATSLGLGTTDSPTFGSSITLNSSSSFLPQMILNNTAADFTGPYWFTKKLRGTSPANSGDSLGTFIFQSNGNDGSTYNAAFIAALSEGAGATWHAAGIVFNTINTSGTTARRMRIRASGAVAIGSDGYDNVNLYMTKSITGGTVAYAFQTDSVFQSDVTSIAIGYGTSLGTQATAFTVNSLQHYRASQGTFGAGSAVSSQYGFLTANNSLIGATSNFSFVAGEGSSVTAGKTYYGFYSTVNIATGGGTAYAFYSGGTALSVFSGSISIGTTLASANLYILKNITGGVNAFNASLDGTILSDVTNIGVGVGSTISTQAAAFTLTSLMTFRAAQGTIGAGSTVTNIYGFNSTGSLIGGTSNYAYAAQDTSAVTAGKTAFGFYSIINTASGGGTTYAFYAAGTAPSIFTGSVGIGTTSLTGITLRASKNITGSTASSVFRGDGTIQSDVTSSTAVFLTSPSTAAAAFTLSSLSHFYAVQGTIGAGSAVTNQYGFRADVGLIDATTNYSFFAGNTAAVGTGKTSYGFYSGINSATGGGTTYAFYAAGSALSYFAGQVAIEQTLWNYAPAPSAQTTTATLTAANLKTGIITATGTSYTLTLPTGTDIDTGFAPLPGTGMGFDFYIVNNASGTVTLAVNTGVSSSGTLTVATGVSAHFRLRRTSANTYVVYRLS